MAELGVLPDPRVAEIVGVTVAVVGKARRRRGIPAVPRRCPLDGPDPLDDQLRAMGHDV